MGAPGCAIPRATWVLSVLIACLLAPGVLRAQTADDYFHGGVTNYIFGQKEKAMEQVVTGLKAYPTDQKLNEVLALLKKEEEQKQQQQQQRQKNDQNKDQKDQNKDQSKDQKNDQKKDSDQKQDQNQSKDQQQKDQQQKQKQDQAKKDADQKKGEDGKKDQDKKEQEQQNTDKQKPEKSDQKDQQEPQQVYAPGQMTPDQAKQLLDAQKSDEMIIPARPEVKPRDPRKPLKDW